MFLILRTVRQIQFLSQATRSILDLHAITTSVTARLDCCQGENELLHLGLAISKMGDALRQQVVELQDKAHELGELNSRLEDANRSSGSTTK